MSELPKLGAVTVTVDRAAQADHFGFDVGSDENTKKPQ